MDLNFAIFSSCFCCLSYCVPIILLTSVRPLDEPLLASVLREFESSMPELDDCCLPRVGSVPRSVSVDWPVLDFLFWVCLRERLRTSYALFLFCMNDFGSLICLLNCWIGLVTLICRRRSKTQEKKIKQIATPPISDPMNHQRPLWISSWSLSVMTNLRPKEWPTTTESVYYSSK